jgi:hypothetical protein
MNGQVPGTTALTAPGATGGGGSLDTERIGNLIRYWVYYDNEINTLNRQLRKLREERQTTEAQILTGFQADRIPQPVIQIAGGRLMVSEDRHVQPLNFKTLESLLHQYFHQKAGAKDETDAIIKYVKAARDVTITPCLKRIVGIPPVGSGQKTG